MSDFSLITLKRRAIIDNKNVIQKQDKYIQFRIDQEHYEKLKISAETYGLSPSLYVKNLAQKSHLKKPYFAHEEAKQVLLELTKQGTNLNQVAKRLNQLDPASADSKELTEALRYTYGVLAQAQKEYSLLWQQLRK
ncbi:plasmid mobilization protein [Dellaglioa algida]|uniref:plasmid mobilization protein n=1 Tax=Dellaglioa algida TaxID=105612 RepID=UPI0024C4D0CD|nr:plasmid mobilization relaxosome protein MobC [Dellaglioa algida]MDK1727324.1 MobC family plasmid mobilization relaxosome protein [Dellaglioa algida]